MHVAISDFNQYLKNGGEGERMKFNNKGKNYFLALI